MRKILFTVLVMAVSICQAQKSPKKSSLKKTEIQLVEEVETKSISADLANMVVATHLKDTLVFTMEDLAKARKIDSLWLKELYATGRFEEMYGAVSEEKFDNVDYEELPTEILKQRLAELNSRTPFNVEYNSSLESVIKSYLKNRRGSLARLMALSDYYFPMFEEELDRHGIPLEMKYLAIVESALDPKARSRVGATGLWQFMYPTGKMFGLDVTSYVDDRSDPVKATEAASKYLKSLYESLGDWDLALAAYNSGPGNVAKAIRRSGGKTNYWNIRKNLPRETASYVPAFLATMYIFEFAEEHGFRSNGPKMPFVATDTVHIKQQISLAQVAEITNLDIAELEFLNPSYKLGVIPVVKGEEYTLRLPITQMGKFVANEEAVYAYADDKANEREPQEFENKVEVTTSSKNQTKYKVRKGDYLGRIASKFGVSVSDIKRWNGIRGNTVRVGQTLNITSSRNESSVVAVAKAASNKPSKDYTVRNGDSLWSISKKFPGVSIQNIQKWNDISGSDLKPGTKLKIYKG